MTWQEKSAAWGRSGKDGESASSTVSEPSRRLPVYLKGLLAGFIVILGGVLAWWFLTSNKTEVARPTPVPVKARPKPTAQPKTAPRPAARPATESPKVEEDEKWQPNFARIPEKRYKFSKLVSAVTNDCGVINQRFQMPDGRFWRRQIDPPPLFENAADNAIAMALGDRAGAPIPPYPGFDDANLTEAFTQSLAQPIRISEDDPPWKAALKMAVKEAREDILAAIKAGDTRSVNEILRDHVQENNRKADLQGDALKGYYKVRDESGEEAAREYLEKVNKALEGFGVEPIKQSGEHGRRRKK